MRGIAYDKDNNIVTCSFCDKPAGSSFMSTDGIINYCMEEHSFLKKESAQFVHDPELEKEKIASSPSICKDFWTVDLRKKE